MKLPPENVWVAAVNLSGLWWETPHEFSRLEDIDGWWSKNGEFSVDKLGVDVKPNIVTFSSKNKKDVELWLSGARAYRYILRGLTN